MILIADSGSTKTDWCLVQAPSIVREITTQGINPVLQDDETIEAVFTQQLLTEIDRLASEVSDVFFYGAGVTPQMQPRMRRLLREHFPKANVRAESDLLGAARALFQLKQGVACILGTGSNSGLYDGDRIVRNVPPLGFILGDEGSGAVMGKRFLGSLYKGLLPEDLKERFEQATGLSLPDVIQRVYREPMPNRFLASLSPFIAENLQCEPLRMLVLEHFQSFFQRNVAAYGRPELPVGIVGSIAHHFRSLVEEAAVKEKIRLEKVVQRPMNGLVDYHTNAVS